MTRWVRPNAHSPRDVTRRRGRECVCVCALTKRGLRGNGVSTDSLQKIISRNIFFLFSVGGRERVGERGREREGGRGGKRERERERERREREGGRGREGGRERRLDKMTSILIVCSHTSFSPRQSV